MLVVEGFWGNNCARSSLAMNYARVLKGKEGENEHFVHEEENRGKIAKNWNRDPPRNGTGTFQAWKDVSVCVTKRPSCLAYLPKEDLN